MYLEHFGLREAPFRITPHTEFFFAGGNRGSTLDALIYAITHDEGIVKVSGEVGSGKTMLCRMLLERCRRMSRRSTWPTPRCRATKSSMPSPTNLACPLPEGRAHLLLRACRSACSKSTPPAARSSS